jgi:hypothetical protein
LREAALRARIAGKLDGAEDLDALRALIATTFERIRIEIVELDTGPELLLYATLRVEAIAGYSKRDGMPVPTPVVRKGPLHLEEQILATAR